VLRNWIRKLRSRPCVVFVAQWPETFEIIRPVVRQLRDSGRDVRIVVTPERDIPHRNSTGAYNHAIAGGLRDWLAAQGLAPEPLLPPEDEAERLRDLRPSAVFLPSPYEGHRHESLAPGRLGLPVHYVDYFLRIGPDDFGSKFDDAFFRECAAVYVNNDYESEQFAHAGVDRSRIIETGPPSLDPWDGESTRAEAPTVLWCPWWSTRWSDTNTAGYSTFITTYRQVLDEAARRPHMQFLFRPHPCLWAELRSESLWTPGEEREFLSRVSALENVTLAGGAAPDLRYPFYADHVRQFEQAWAMVTDGISFLAEFGYTGKPLLLTQAPGNPGWNPVGQAIADAVERTEGVNGLASFLDRVERGIDPDAEKRREVIRRQFYRPPGGSAAAIARHVAKTAD